MQLDASHIMHSTLLSCGLHCLCVCVCVCACLACTALTPCIHATQDIRSSTCGCMRWLGKLSRCMDHGRASVVFCTCAYLAGWKVVFVDRKDFEQEIVEAAKAGTPSA